MTIKKFIISTGDGDLEESELDYGGHRTIGYDDSSKKIIISNLDVINNLNISGTVSGSFVGDGSGLSGVTSDNFTDFANNIYTHLSAGNNIDITTESNKVVISSNALMSIFTDNTNLSGNGTAEDPVILKNNISGLNSIETTYLTSSYVYVPNNIKINGTASIAFIETISQSSLQIGDKYIIILSGGADHVSLDRSGILWGSGSAGPTVDENGANAYVKYSQVSDQLEIFPGLKVVGAFSSSNGITGSFAGDGSGITSIPSSAVDLSLYAKLDDVSGTFASKQSITSSFTSPTQVSSAVENYVINEIYDTFAELRTDNYFTSSQYIQGLISASAGISGSFYGNGKLLTHITSSNIDNFINDVRAQHSAGDNLSYEDGSFRLKNNIQLNSVTSSFSGSGLNISNITASNIQNFNFDILSKFTSGSNLTYITSSESGTYQLNDNIQLSSVTSSFSGDAANLLNANPKIVFNYAPQAIQVGHIVALSSSGLMKSDNLNNLLSNAIGVVCYSGSGEIHVQTAGEIELNVIDGTYTTGTVIYVGDVGHGTTYPELVTGNYVTQIGYISGNGGKKIVLQPRVFGQL